MHPWPSSRPQPFYLSHLELTLAFDVNRTLLDNVLGGSRSTLTTLTLARFGDSPTSLDSTLGVLSHSPFLALRHLFINGGYSAAFLQILPLLPALEELKLANLQDDVFHTVFGKLASVTLSVLDFRDLVETMPASTLAFSDLLLSLSTPSNFPNLRQLRLSPWFRRGVEEGPWEELEAQCERRSLALFVIPSGQ